MRTERKNSLLRTDDLVSQGNRPGDFINRRYAILSRHTQSPKLCGGLSIRLDQIQRTSMCSEKVSRAKALLAFDFPALPNQIRRKTLAKVPDARGREMEIVWDTHFGLCVPICVPTDFSHLYKKSI